MRNLREEFLQQCSRPLGVAAEATEARGPKAPPPLQSRIAGRQLGRQLEELGGRGGRTPGAGLLGRSLQVRGDPGVGAVGRERQMAGLLLEIRDDAGECPMNGAALPERRLLVADRCEEGIREAETRVVEVDDAFAGGDVEGLKGKLPVSVRCRDQFDRRPRQRGDMDENIGGPDR